MEEKNNTHFDLITAYMRVKHFFGADGQILLHGMSYHQPSVRISVLRHGTSFNREFQIKEDSDYNDLNYEFNRSIRAIGQMLEEYFNQPPK